MFEISEHCSIVLNMAKWCKVWSTNFFEGDAIGISGMPVLGFLTSLFQ